MAQEITPDFQSLAEANVEWLKRPHYLKVCSIISPSRSGVHESIKKLADTVDLKSVDLFTHHPSFFKSKSESAHILTKFKVMVRLADVLVLAPNIDHLLSVLMINSTLSWEVLPRVIMMWPTKDSSLQSWIVKDGIGVSVFSNSELQQVLLALSELRQSNRSEMAWIKIKNSFGR